MKEVTKIQVMSLAKIQALVGLALGLLFGILVNITGSFMGMAQQMGMQGQTGWQALIWLPAGYAISGFLMGLVVGWLYNLFAAKIGGIKIELR